MSSTPARVNWYGEEVALLVEGIARSGLLQAAFQVEAEAKIDAPVDTGFMRNSVYVHSKESSTFRPKTEEIDGVLHVTVGSPPQGDDNTVFVGVGALYAIYVESEQPFLYPALLRVSRQVGGMIQAQARGQL